MSCRRVAPTSGCPMTRPARVCTRRHGSTPQSGFSTAYIGSSNLTHSAQISGLEWNVRVSGARNPDVIDKVAAVFESYWHNPDFRPYDREEFRIRAESRPTRATILHRVPLIFGPNRSKSGCSSRSRYPDNKDITAIFSWRLPVPGRPSWPPLTIWDCVKRFLAHDFCLWRIAKRS